MCAFLVDTGRKLNVRKLNVRPGSLLNVLCTFRLRPVSTGLLIYIIPIIIVFISQKGIFEKKYIVDQLWVTF